MLVFKTPRPRATSSPTPRLHLATFIVTATATTTASGRVPEACQNNSPHNLDIHWIDCPILGAEAGESVDASLATVCHISLNNRRTDTESVAGGRLGFSLPYHRNHLQNAVVFRRFRGVHQRGDLVDRDFLFLRPWVRENGVGRSSCQLLCEVVGEEYSRVVVWVNFQ